MNGCHRLHIINHILDSGNDAELDILKIVRLLKLYFGYQPEEYSYHIPEHVYKEYQQRLKEEIVNNPRSLYGNYVKDIKPLEIAKDQKPWYVKAGSKGGSKRRKQFIK